MAARYWVGGNATWDATAGTKWALTSGGAGGQTVPGAADTVFFTALSGTVTVTWTTASATVVSINSTGFTGTHATGGNNKTLNGTGTVWTSPATCTIIGASTLTVNSTGATAISVTCNHASPSATNAPTFSFTGGTYALTLSGTGFNSILTTGYSGSASGSASVRNSVTLGSTGTFNGLFLTFLASATFTSGGRTLGRVTLQAPAGGTLTLNGALTTGTSSALGFYLTSGTLNLNSFTLTCGEFISNNTLTRSISFGTGNIIVSSNISGAINPVLDFRAATGFTWTGTGIFIFSGAPQNFVAYGSTAGGSTNPIDLDMRSPSTRQYITNGSWFRNLSFSTQASSIGGTSSTPTVLTNAPVNITGNLTLNSGGTYTFLSPTFLGTTSFNSLGKTLGSTTVNGAGITVTLTAALTLGVAHTFTLTQGTLDLAGFTLSTGTFSSTNTNTRAIAFGTGNIALTGTTLGATLLSMANATNFTYTGTGGFTRNMVAITTFDFGTTGGSTTNAPNLTLTGGTNNASFNTGGWFRNFNCSSASSGVLGTFNLAGNLIINPSSSYNAFNPTFRATTNFNTLGNPSFGNITVNGAGIAVSLSSTGGGTTVIAGITLTEGALNITTNLRTATFSSSNSNVRALTLTNGITFTISGFLGWDIQNSTNMTLTAGTSTINMSHTGSKTFNGGGLTYYNLNQATSGSSYLTITGSNSFNNITNTLPSTGVIFQAGTTQTVANFGLSGAPGSFNTCLIQSTIAGSQFTLSKSSGAVESKFLRIQDSNVTGGASWYAYNSTNLGNNTGWKFNSPDMLAMFI